MKRSFIFILLIGGGLFLTQTIIAAGGTTLGISPVVFELTGNPGDVIVNQIKVYNPSDDSIIGITMEVENISPRGEGGQVFVDTEASETYSLMKWVEVNPKEFVLEPGEQEFITFTISIPENAEPGGHYGAVLASTNMVAGSEFTGTAIAQKIGSVVLLSVSGKVEEKLEVLELFTPNYSESGPIPFVIKFENKGTIHVKPSGHITITNWLGMKLADIEFPQNNVLPGAIRKIETSWNAGLLLAGRYTATVHGSYGSSNTSFTPKVISFWGFSWKTGIVVLMVVMFFVLTRRRWMAAFKILIKGEKSKI